jgi:hypothetical protein
MSEDKKTAALVSVGTAENSRGDRGEVGTPTAACTIKQRWAEAKKTNPRLSLKQFARGLVKTKDANALDWFARKKGSMNQKRSDKNATEAKLAGSATKLKKRTKKAKEGAK